MFTTEKNLWLSSSCFCFAVMWLKLGCFLLLFVIDMGVQHAPNSAEQCELLTVYSKFHSGFRRASNFDCSSNARKFLMKFSVLRHFRVHWSRFCLRVLVPSWAQAIQFNLECFSPLLFDNWLEGHNSIVFIKPHHHHRDLQRQLFNWNWLKLTDCLLSFSV